MTEPSLLFFLVTLSDVRILAIICFDQSSHTCTNSSNISIKHERPCLPQFTGRPKRVQNMVGSEVFLMNFKVFKGFTGQIEWL